MTLETGVRIASLCVVLACTETLHGVARTMFLAPRLGKERALRLSIISGSLLAFVVCYFLVPGIGASTLPQQLALGACLSAFMASFDLVMGRLLLRRPWRRALDDFNPASGNLLIVGLILLAGFPALVMLIRSGR